MEVRGPFGHFHYDRPGHYKNHKLESEVKRINMIAGGTGLTPMYQVMKAILSNPADLTEIRLLYANQTEADILLRPELEALAKSHPDRCVPAPQQPTMWRIPLRRRAEALLCLPALVWGLSCALLG